MTYSTGVRVAPDGNRNAGYVVCGEAPAMEEVRQGRGFVGPSGKLVWPVLRRLAYIVRDEVWTTNLCKHPLDNDGSDGDSKLSEEEFAECRSELCAELADLPNVHSVLAVGALAARALLGDDLWAGMTVNNGISYSVALNAWRSVNVVPCWHPAAALRGAGDGKDPLAWMGDAMRHFPVARQRRAFTADPPDWTVWDPRVHIVDAEGTVGVDTEGTPAAPECMTLGTLYNRYLVMPEDVPMAYARIRDERLVFHNAPWDWAVLEAMGVAQPWAVDYRDTMEKAYLRQTEPQGLKDLGRRWLGVRMVSWEDTVMPYYGQLVRAAADGAIEAGTKVTTHSPKTGKAYKKPKVERTEAAKKLARLTDPHKLAGALGFEAPSLKLIPFDVFGEYATLDAWVTRQMAGVWA